VASRPRTRAELALGARGGLPRVPARADGCLRLAGIRLGIHSALPFGPFLALATWVLWLLSPSVEFNAPPLPFTGLQ